MHTYSFRRCGTHTVVAIVALALAVPVWLGAAADPAPAEPSCSPKDPACEDGPLDDVPVPAGARFTWRQHDRYWASWNAWSPSTDRYASDYATPDGFAVDLDACGSSGGVNVAGRPESITAYRWDVDGPGRAVQPAPVQAGSCRFAASFEEEGAYDVRLTVTDVGGDTYTVRHQVVVDDLVIVSLGDSNASGEGNPNSPGYPDPRPRWSDRQCHRSQISGPALAAQQLEAAGRDSVTFLSLACSGADVHAGILGRYNGIEPEGQLDAQVDVMEEMLCPSGAGSCRDVDAILVSIGVNDLGFRDILMHCAIDTRTFHDCSTDSDFVIGVNEKFHTLDASFDELGVRLEAGPLARAEVYITEYPDDPFDGGAGCGFLRKINSDEGAWLHDLGVRLNDEIRRSAARNGWNYVGEIADGFRGHGYCADDPWFRGFWGSVEGQGNIDGTLHPNASGHAHTAGRVAAAVEAGAPDRAPVSRARVTFDQVRVEADMGVLPVQELPLSVSLMAHALENGVGVESGGGMFPGDGTSVPLDTWVDVPDEFSYSVELAGIHTLRVRAVTEVPGRMEWSPRDRDYVSEPPRLLEAEANFAQADGFGAGEGRVMVASKNGASISVRYHVTAEPADGPGPGPSGRPPILDLGNGAGNTKVLAQTAVPVSAAAVARTTKR
jgi:hypothetical protein